MGPFGSNIITKGISVAILFIILIILFLHKKPLGPLYIPKLNTKGIKYCIYDGIFYVAALLLLGISFYYNDKLDSPINLGILTSIISLSFIFTILIDTIVDYIYKKPLKLKVEQLIGAIFIIIGIIFIALNS